MYDQKARERPSMMNFIFFQEGKVTNSAIWLVLYAVRIFLSLPTGTVTLAWDFVFLFTKPFKDKSLFFQNSVLLDKKVEKQNLSFQNRFSLQY